MTAFAHLSGVVHGDGWVAQSIGLRVKDEDFATTFADALAIAFGCTARPRRDERGYWLIRVGNKSGRFNGLLALEPATNAERGAWLRGLFDSEGCAYLGRAKISANSYNRSVTMYSTNLTTLERAVRFLAAIEIRATIGQRKNGAGHWGTKTVYELDVSPGRENYKRFAELVGSSLARKAATLKAIPDSYRLDPKEHVRRAQKLGAATRRARTLATVLPAYLAGVRQLVEYGKKPTQRACAAIPGHSALMRYFKHSELVQKAING